MTMNLLKLIAVAKHDCKKTLPKAYILIVFNSKDRNV